MSNWGNEFSFFQGIHVRIDVRTDVRTDISISVRPTIIKSGSQVHLQDLTQMRLIKQVLVTSSRQDNMTN